MLSYLLILLFCTLDHLFTFWELSTGWAYELNPLLIDLMNLPLYTSLPVRMLWVLTGLLGLRFLSSFKPVLIKKCLSTLVFVYGLVIVYHGTVIYRITSTISSIHLTGRLY